MEEPIRVAIIGCGWAGKRHAQAYEQCGAEIRWAVDVDREQAEALRGTRTTTRVSTNYQQALADPDVLAIDICLPHDLHASVTIAAAAAGKHILCEKPLAATLEEADRMIQAAHQAGVILMVAENERFNPLWHRVRELVQDGMIGRPALIQVTRQVYMRSPPQWYLNERQTAGGIMMTGGIHEIERMRMLVGEVKSVYALRARQRLTFMQGDDTSTALLQFQDGTIGTLVESFLMKSLSTAAGSEVHTLRIDGDLGSLAVQDGRTIHLFSEGKNVLPWETLTQLDLLVPEADTFVLEIEHFLQALRTSQEPLTSGRSQRRALEIVLAAYQSMQTGRPVAL
jgi:predicted dehydrogenase